MAVAQAYPEFKEQPSCLPPGSFLTCSSDNTIRVWTLGSGPEHPCRGNAYSTVRGGCPSPPSQPQKPRLRLLELALALPLRFCPRSQ